jgi:CRP-like cAMP-binding protein
LLRKRDPTRTPSFPVLEKAGTCCRFQKKQTIFVQGDSSDELLFIQKGKVQLTVVSEGWKEATLGVLSEDDFFGEGGLAGQPRACCARPQ